mmetsp:Transcript_64271/g.155389  ORF Transcript_64271/g.155389 Transcript_64271/m.155389 type:complete len:281 (-) Transcript_64271:117-959(-)
MSLAQARYPRYTDSFLLSPLGTPPPYPPSSTEGACSGMYANDIESGRMAQASPQVHLAVESARRGFVRKVYSLVAIQLGATALLAAPVATASDSWLEAHGALFMASTFGFLVLAVGLTCGLAHLLRQYPWNLVILGAFTVLESVSVGFFCAMFEVQSIVVCLGATATIAGALSLVACNTKVDITGLGGYLRAMSLSLFVLGLAGIFLRVPLLQAAYSVGGAILFSGYLVYDTQLVVGGKHQEKRFSIDDYVLAALSIYMDLVRLFMFLLRLFGEQRRSRR